tara:strand:- start:1410 stop:1709 length:300 start_codon:yes stop_codon:yes gene_type:complete
MTPPETVDFYLRRALHARQKNDGLNRSSANARSMLGPRFGASFTTLQIGQMLGKPVQVRAGSVRQRTYDALDNAHLTHKAAAFPANGQVRPYGQLPTKA